VGPAQLHPNSWAFIRAFDILYGHFGHSPSVDVFLHFFEAKNPGKNLWVSFSGIAGRVILNLFQQSYKGFRGKFFRVCNSEADPTALDGFPLYWVGKLKPKKAKTLDELSSADREVCQVLASLGVIFNTAELIKNEYDPAALTRYIGMGIIPSLPSSNSDSVYASSRLLYKLIPTLIFLAYLTQLFSSGANMVLDAEKRTKLAGVLSIRGKATSGGAGTSTQPAPAASLATSPISLVQTTPPPTSPQPNPQPPFPQTTQNPPSSHTIPIPTSLVPIAAIPLATVRTSPSPAKNKGVVIVLSDDDEDTAEGPLQWLHPTHLQIKMPNLRGSIHLVLPRPHTIWPWRRELKLHQSPPLHLPPSFPGLSSMF